LDEQEDEEDRAAIAALWAQTQPRILERIGTIDLAVAQLTADAVTDDALAAATSESHKLAGSLGTFGVPEGSRVAKELELLLGRPAVAADAADATRLAAELRTAVQAGPT
jgi:HPt (histidine-containing phosphotransfer) domain-containing protein